MFRVSEFLSLASGWRDRARELLARANTMHDAHARRKMREIAAGYERLAQRVEERCRAPLPARGRRLHSLTERCYNRTVRPRLTAGAGISAGRNLAQWNGGGHRR
jgi:hypothetical protein